jgi:dynein heavy chain 1
LSVVGLQRKIVVEAEAIEIKIKDSLQEWEKSKPIQGNLEATKVLSVLSMFEGRFSRLDEDRDQINKAKLALDLEIASESQLPSILEEVRDFKSVWSALAKVWASLNEIREISWLSCVPRKIRQQLEACSTEMKDLPTKYVICCIFKLSFMIQTLE